MQKVTQKRILYFVKIAITIIILYFVFRRIDFKQVLENFSQISFISLIVLIITAIIKHYFHYKNWGEFLSLNPKYKSNRFEELKSYLIGEALRFLLPGGYGTYGKMYFVNNSKKATTISVSVEKFFVIWTSLIFASFAAIFYFDQFQMILKIVVFIALLSLPFIISFIRIFIRHEKADAYFKNYSNIFLKIISRQIFYTLLTLLQYFIIMNNFARISFIHTAISIPLVLSANILPITYSGLGLRETFAIEVLDRFSITPEVAVSCSLGIFIINNVLPALFGAFFILRSKEGRK